MQVSGRLEKKARTERQKLKEVFFQDELWYIREYYKFHILGVLISLGILQVIGTSTYRSTYESGLYCMYINNCSEQKLNIDVLTVDFHDFMEFTDGQLVDTESLFISCGDDTSGYSYASIAKISALVTSNELGVVISDKENLLHYASLNAFSNLEKLLPADLLGQVKGRLYYADDESGVSYTCNIMLDDTVSARESNLASTPCPLGVVSNSKHTDNRIALTRCILSYQIENRS